MQNEQVKHAIKAMTLTEGWGHALTIFNNIVKQANDKAMDEENDAKAIVLLRKAKASREAVRDLLRAVVIATAESDEEPQWFSNLTFLDGPQDQEQGEQQQ